MLKKKLQHYKEEFKKCINDLKHKKTFYKQIPNLITISRPLGMIPANILFFTGHKVFALVLTTLLLSTDFIDGKLARKWNVQSNLGADLDAVGDKIIFLGMSLPLILSNHLFIINVLLELAISYINIKGRIHELDTKTVYFGKVKTWFLSATLVAGYLTHFFNLPLSIFITFMIGTSINQSIALHEYISNYKKMKQISLETNQKFDKQNEDSKEKNDTKSKTIEDVKQELINEKELLLSSKEETRIIENTKTRIRKK